MDKKKPAENIGTQEELLRILFDESRDAVFISDTNGKFLDVNSRGCELFKAQRKDVLKLSVTQVVVPDDLIKTPIKTTEIRTGHPVTRERLVQRPDGSRFQARVTAYRLDDKRLLTVVKDITSEAAEKRRYESIVDAASEGIWSMDADHRTMYVNPRMADMLGYTAEEMLGHPVEDFISSVDLNDHQQRMIKRHEGVPENYQRKLRRKDGSEVICQVFASALKDINGKFAGSFALFTDVSEQTRLEESLQETLEFQRVMLDNIQQAVVLTDPDGKFIRVNNAFLNMFGYSLAEVEKLTIQSVTTPEYFHASHKAQIDLLNGSKQLIEMEKEYIRKDGSRLWAATTGTSVRNEDGSIRYLTAFIRDLTKQKLATRDLEESEERNRTILEHLSEAVFVHDRDGHLIYVNQAASTQTGFSREELLRMKVMDIDAGSVDRDDKGSIWDQLQKDKLITIEVEHRRKNGSTYPAEVRISTMIYHGDLVILATARDISERMQAEKLQKESEERINAIFEHLSDAVYVHKLDGKLLFVNHASSRQTGYTRHELLEMHVDQIDAVSTTRKDLDNLWKKIDTGQQTSFESMHRRKDGTIFPVEIHLGRMTLQGEEIIFGTVHDITERKKVEEALKKSEERFQLAMEAANEGIWDLDVVTNQVYCSPGYWKMLGYDPATSTLDNQFWIDLLHDGDRDRVVGAMQECIDQKNPNYVQEFRLRTGDGGWKWIYSQGRVIYTDDKRQAIRVLGTHTDITERKLALQALQISEDRLSKTLLASNDGYWDWDLLTNEVYFSERYYQMAGYAVNEFPHKFEEFKKRVHPEDLDRVLAVSDRHLKGEVDRFEVEFRFLSKDGTWMWIQGRGLITEKDADGHPVRFTGTHTDITDRVRAARELENAYHTSSDIVKAIPSGLFIYQFSEPDQLRLVQANPQANAITGIKLKEWAGREFNEIWPEAKRLGITEKYLEVMKTGKTFETDDLIYEDSRLSGAYHVLAFRLPENRLAVAFEDITIRKQAESLLKEKTEELEQFFQNNLDLLCIADTDGRFIRLNNEWENILGYPLHELEGANFMDFVHPDDREATLKTVSVLESQKVVLNFTNRYRCKDGSYRFIEWRSYPVGKTIYAAARDITERIQTETTLNNRKQELESLFLLSKELRAAQSREEILEISARELHKLVKLDGLSVNLINPEGSSYKVVYADGIAAPNLGKTHTTTIPIAQAVLQSQQVIYINDYASSPQRNIDSIDTDKMGPVAIIQIRSEMGIIGAFSLMRISGAEEFSPDNLHLFLAIGEMVGNALRRSGLFEQAMTRLKQVQALHEIDMAISTSLDQNFSLQAILDRTIRLMEVDAASVLLLNPTTLQLEYKAGQGFFHPRSFEGMTIRLGESIAGQVALRQVRATINDLPSQNEYPIADRLVQEKFTCMHASPMIVKGQVIGVLQAFHRSECPGDPEKIDFLDALAAQAAIAVSNARMFADLEKSNLELQLAYDATIEGWSLATDLRDKETEGHSLRVASVAIKLAELMGLAGKDIVHIRRGGLLHDIGKLAIPDSILFKPGPLTDEEWVLMRQHPVHAREMLQHISFLKRALPIPLYHHEKFDGSGYPNGLTGEQIPLPARIFAIVDVYDALSSDRPYRKAWPTERILEYLKQESGKHFDPQVVTAFLNNFEYLIN